MQSFFNLDNKLIQSDIRCLKEDKVMLRNYAKFLWEEHYFVGEEISDCSWIYENDQCDVFVWLIRGFSEKRISHPEQRSRKFAIGQKGYRAQLEVSLNGINEAAGTHLSIFLRLQPGPFDTSLHWPFNRPYKMSLFNLKDMSSSSIHIMSVAQMKDFVSDVFKGQSITIVMTALENISLQNWKILNKILDS